MPVAFPLSAPSLSLARMAVALQETTIARTNNKKTKATRTVINTMAMKMMRTMIESLWSKKAENLQQRKFARVS